MSGPDLDPKIDVVFKALFGRRSNTDLLVSLLNGILELAGDQEIDDVEILNPLSELESGDDKLSILDLFVRDRAGRQYVVEMQCRDHRAFPERVLYYGARRYSEQLGRGDLYTRLQPIVVVVFTDFVLFESYQAWRQRFRLRAVDGSVFSDHLEIVLVELPKFHPQGSGLQEPGESWVCFLKEGLAMKTRLFDEPWVTPQLRRAIDELSAMASDETMRELYEARVRQVQVWATELEDSYEQGIEQGIEKGIEKGKEQGQRETRLDLARSLLAEGEPTERIARLTGLDHDEIAAMR